MSGQPVLRVENITKSLGGNPILQGVSLDLHKSNLKVLIGPSGGGKSTFLQCINFLITPDAGKVYLDGAEITGKNKRELRSFRQQVGMIFQDFNLFDHLTALENVRVALCLVRKWPKDKATERAMAELARVGLASRANHYPAQLSGGQKQRVSVARALAMDPKVMLLDEPTSALDPELIGEVLAVIRDLADLGMPMIMATHQIGFASSLADEFLFMDHGVIVERGAPAVLLARDADSRTRAFCAKITELTGEMGGMTQYLDFALGEVAPQLVSGLWVSLKIIIPASFFGVLLGMTAGALRVYAGPKTAWVTDLYVSLFRGTPLVVQLYFWYFALPYVHMGDFRLILSPMAASILGFALCSGAYQSEYIRGGLLSIKRGQLKAALALGMTPFQAVRRIVLPQAFRRAFPGCGNEIIYLIKYSSLASIITVNDLTGVGRGIAKATWRSTETYLVVGLYYLALVTLATLALRWAERKLSIPGFEYREE